MRGGQGVGRRERENGGASKLQKTPEFVKLVNSILENYLKLVNFTNKNRIKLVNFA